MSPGTWRIAYVWDHDTRPLWLDRDCAAGHADDRCSNLHWFGRRRRLGGPYHYYAITVTANSIVDFSFAATNPAGLITTNPTYSSGLALYGANGTTQIAYTDFVTGSATASIEEGLGVGTFYLKVDNPNLAGSGTDYTLTVTAGPTTGNVTPASITHALLPPTGSIEFVDNSLEAQAGRLYQAAFGRAPDAAGLAFWSAQLHAGTSLAAVAADFIASPEFASRYGTPGNAGFVTDLYQNVLGRAPDAAGLTYWQGQLDAGTATQAAVLADFANSAENEANTPPSANAQSAARLYWAELGRAPDSAGLTYWTTQLSNGTATLSQEADALAASPEFATRFPNLDNNGFVTQLYQNVLGRAPDAAGLASWTNALATGETRGQVTTNFSESAEAVSRFSFLDGQFGIVVTP